MTARFPTRQSTRRNRKVSTTTRARSRSGKVERNAKPAGSICDALLAPEPGAIGWEINAERLAGGVTASDAEALVAVGFAFDELRLVVEPGGAVGLAALLAGRVDVAGKTVVIVLSGGNVGDDILGRGHCRLSLRRSRSGL